MLPSKTVFVLGAGASKEVGLPLGEELKKIIATMLDLRFDLPAIPIGKGDLRIFKMLIQAFPQAINDYLGAGWRIRDGVGLSASIDDFIDTHRDDKNLVVCGKIAIAAAILDAERHSKLHFERTNVNNTINFESIGDTWYPAFYKVLSTGIGKNDLGDLLNNATVVSFNYDRCIEHFLVHAIASHYQIPRDEAHELARKLPVYHPYGSVGEYFASPGLSFGSLELPSLDKILNSLRTYTEEVAEGESISAIREAVSQAEVLVFLGNAYHQNNLKLLAPEKFAVPFKKVYATRKGISEPDLAVLSGRLSNLHSSVGLARPPHYFAGTCADLFDTYRMSLRG